MKICTRCKKQKQLSEFCRQTKSKDGLQSQCKICVSIKRKQYRANNREKLRELSKNWYYNNIERAKETSHKWHKQNPNRVKELCKKWCKKNPEKTKEKGLKASRKYRTTIKGKLNHIMSNGILRSIKNHSKSRRHWETLVNYTSDQLKKHLQKLFKSGMTWENYGKIWHIDHKIPISVFNFKSPEDIDFKHCWALKNLQPLEAIENIKKNAKIYTQFQPSLSMRINIGVNNDL